MQKGYVVLSGGIDSTTCLALAVAQHGRENVKAFSVNYGQRHARELNAAHTIAEQYGVRHQLLHLGNQPISNLTNPLGRIPEVSYEAMGAGMSPSYHYFRNAQILSACAAHAVHDMDTLAANPGGYEGPDESPSSLLYWGAHAEDSANWAYADCTPEFSGAMANAIFIGTYRKLRLVTPLQWMTKEDIIRLGTKFQTPYFLTWSCYIGGDAHCGKCPTCLARKSGFHRAGIADPTVYQE